MALSGRRGGLPLRRLLLLSYVPCGFWARLSTRLLADAALAKAVPLLYTVPSAEVSHFIRLRVHEQKRAEEFSHACGAI